MIVVKVTGVISTVVNVTMNVLNFVFVPPGGSLTERFKVQLPKNVIDGSDRASVSVLGNHMS